MTIVFERPTGAHRDVKELEYISALHQSAQEIRKDGTVTAEDVATFLVSRHGIKIDVDTVRQELMPGLAGLSWLSQEEEEEEGSATEEVFNLIDLVAMLLIPHIQHVVASSSSSSSSQKDEDPLNHFFGEIVNRLMANVSTKNNGDPLLLNDDTLRQIMETYGISDPPQELLNEMLEAAAETTTAAEDLEKDASGGTGTTLSVESLARATSFDTDRYQPEWTNTCSTHFDDVFEEPLSFTKQQQPQLPSNKDREDDGTKDGTRADSVAVTQQTWTLSSIDFVAETYASKAFVPLVWVLAVVLYFCYFFDVEEGLGNTLDCDRFRAEFGCRVVNAIVAWLLIFFELSIILGTFIILASTGTSIYKTSVPVAMLLSLVGLGTVAVGALVTFPMEGDYYFFNLDKDSLILLRAGYILTLVFGGILILFHLQNVVYALLPRRMLEQLPGSGEWLLPGMAKAERNTKRAADYKVGQMVKNAMEVLKYDPGASQQQRRRYASGEFGKSALLLNFQALAHDRESCGGILWAYQKLWNGSMFVEEGVWLHARLLACNLCQYMIVVAYVLIGIMAEDYARNETDRSPTAAPNNADSLDGLVNSVLGQSNGVLTLLANQTDEFHARFWNRVDPHVATRLSSAILNSVPTGVVRTIANATDPSSRQAFVDAAQQQARRFLDVVESEALESQDFFNGLEEHRWEIFLSVGMGGLVAVLATLAIAIVWLPSAVSTILQFRSGVIGSLRDADFSRYRKAPDQTTILLGSNFWGVSLASLYLFVIVASVCFVLVYDASRSIVYFVLAQIVGIGVTVGTKIVILMFLRRMLYTGFYRRQPGCANVMLVLLECWSLGLTVGTMLVRFVKLILVTAFYVGRIDTPVLADGVGNVAGAPLDSYPIQFRKDLLVHDAHRHPYMERLGVVYMLKLKHGNEFGCRAGSAWRSLVVMALMPWLSTFRSTGKRDPTDNTTTTANKQRFQLETSMNSRSSSTSSQELEDELQRKDTEIQFLRSMVKELRDKSKKKKEPSERRKKL